MNNIIVISNLDNPLRKTNSQEASVTPRISTVSAASTVANVEHLAQFILCLETAKTILWYWVSVANFGIHSSAVVLGVTWQWQFPTETVPRLRVGTVLKPGCLLSLHGLWTHFMGFMKSHRDCCRQGGLVLPHMSHMHTLQVQYVYFCNTAMYLATYK